MSAPKKGIAECVRFIRHNNCTTFPIPTNKKHTPILHSTDEIELGKQKSSTENVNCVNIMIYVRVCVCLRLHVSMSIPFNHHSSFSVVSFFLLMEFKFASRNKYTKDETKSVLTAIDVKEQFEISKIRNRFKIHQIRLINKNIACK